ncbi:ATP-binding protein [Leptodesmis sichuanensis]|uniref:ATP-binding protein n=1 Tax=Leptodesmis sichuanensis TaxID=2906798 RepID=UPI001F2AD571|nr:ATP-binding protein [Leptodesmis sichuanensis]UIE37688.1 ATP-binding protein [Leptodesmis sichuanensis A121]
MATSPALAYSLLCDATSLLLYQSVLENEVGQSFLHLLQAIHQVEQSTTPDPAAYLACLRAYSGWFNHLANCNQDWAGHLVTRILRDDNPFSRQASYRDWSQLPEPLVNAARQDLQGLQHLADCNSASLSTWIATTCLVPSPLVWQTDFHPPPGSPWEWFQQSPDWQMLVEPLASYYRAHGTGMVSEYRAFRWQAGHLVGIPHPDPVRLSHLVGYEAQREALLKNTEFLLAGYPALHVLLYGSRGSGKSSLVKALLHEYGEAGLRLIEVGKSDLRELPAIADQLRELPQKFIIFVDDLSFEEDEDTFKALKVVLEGNLTARPQNVVVYATSNRRHLIREFFGDRPRPKDSDEVHAWDTVQEKLSFSDRFGLTLTFEPPNQASYLQIIHHLAKQAGIALPESDLEFQALQWATRHNGRSGRTARQFIDFLKADLSLFGESQ